jgi:hypothetical protein
MAVFTKVGLPSLTSVPQDSTARISCQKAAATIACGDICSLGAGGWTPTATAAAGLRMVWTPTASVPAGTPVTPLNPGCRVRYGAPSGGSFTPGALLYLDAGAAGGLNTTSNGSPIARVLANSSGVFEGVIELL